MQFLCFSFFFCWESIPYCCVDASRGTGVSLRTCSWGVITVFHGLFQTRRPRLVHRTSISRAASSLFALNGKSFILQRKHSSSLRVYGFPPDRWLSAIRDCYMCSERMQYVVVHTNNFHNEACVKFPGLCCPPFPQKPITVWWCSFISYRAVVAFQDDP